MALKLEYVFSAPAMLRIVPTKWGKENPEGLARFNIGVATTLSYLRETLADITKADIKISLLFNAFTEDSIGKFICDQGKFGFDSLYADSGGLQMVTTNREVTPALKAQIYETQKLANYGFCFDEIPLGTKEGVNAETAKHRSQTASKIFRQNEFDACIDSTARNLKEQTEAFMGTETKAFYILQGNNSEEMVRWFRGSQKYFTPDHYKQLQGLAPADTCMGNGALESVDMISACHHLRNEFGRENVGDHIHFLGVGSPSRLLPAVFLSQGGYLDPDVHVSFDSSTGSMCLIMGNMVNRDGTRVRRRLQETIALFMSFFDEMEPVLRPIYGETDRDQFHRHVFEHYKSLADLINNAPPELEHFMRIAATALPLWQTVGFFNSLMASINDPETQMSGLGFLSSVKTDDDMRAWRKQFQNYLKSSKIDRVTNNILSFD